MKRVKVLMTTALIASVLSATAWAGEWKSDAKGWWWQNDDGSYPVSQWKEIHGKQYYFGADGYMLANTTTPDGYRVGVDGAWIFEEQTEVQDNQYLDAYAAFLRSYKIPKGKNSIKPKFHLLYIDGDAIPELVIAEDSSHANRSDLYGYNQGEVYKIGSFGGYGVFTYVHGANLFCETYAGSGTELTTFYTLQSNTAVPLIQFYAYDNNDDWIYDEYSINNIPVTEAAYNSQDTAWDSVFTPISYAGYFYGHTLNEANIKKMLENIQNVMPENNK